MWKNKTITVVLPTYNEKNSIRKCINDFFATGVVDEVIVVNNNAAKGTKEEVDKTSAKQVFEIKQGYGHAIMRGIHEAGSDLVVIAEPDGTFIASDIFKFLTYSDQCDVVFGSRTNKTLILQDANMGLFLKWGNVFIAKLCEVFFNTTYLSDVGCTMRILNRKAVNNLKNKFSVGGSHFGLEMMLLVFVNKLNYIEIPINYNKRVGKSSVTGSFWKALFLGFAMIYYVFKFRIKTWFKKY